MSCALESSLSTPEAVSSSFHTSSPPAASPGALDHSLSLPRCIYLFFAVPGSDQGLTHAKQVQYIESQPSHLGVTFLARSPLHPSLRPLPCPFFFFLPFFFFCLQGFLSSKAVFCLLSTLPDPHTGMGVRIAEGCSSICPHTWKRAQGVTGAG
jgi:hypothetical protein